MGKMDSLVLRSKFRGSMLGLLMGDCLGSAYEGEKIFGAGMKLVIQKSFDKLEGPHYRAPVMQFTDDSSMAYSLTKSLIERGGFDRNDMAKKFVKSYYKEPNRGYGSGVITVFEKLRNNKFVDVSGPAREQFNGQGSLGNGAAMRVAPVALFCHKNQQMVIDMAREQSQITHTHKLGVDGAILQAIAVHQSLLLDPKEELDTCKFADDLIDKMDKIEFDDDGLGLGDPSPYKSQLKLVKQLVGEGGDGSHAEKVVHLLGNDVSALHSVPTAIYCFLRAYRPIKNVQTENPLRRTIQYAENSLPISCDATSVGKKTTDAAASVEYDAYDIFAQNIAAHLRAMDVETALRAQDYIQKVITDHRLRKPETISLGGDTDTIGSMAGAIAGAFYGEELIKPDILKHCEYSTEFKDLADQLFDAASV